MPGKSPNPHRGRRLVLRWLPSAAFSIVGVGAAMADQAAAAGTFGFVAKVDADGWFNPRLKSVLIQSVVPGLPAATAGLAVGDIVVEVDGRAVAGAAASEMADLMKKTPGQKLNLKLRRPRGDTYTVELTAVRRP
jgi:C-terminal processing protease CtpA/Prc